MCCALATGAKLSPILCPPAVDILRRRSYLVGWRDRLVRRQPQNFKIARKAGDFAGLIGRVTRFFFEKDPVNVGLV